MRAYDIIHELYLGNLRPCDRSFRKDTDFAITMDSFTAQERWFRENLNGETAKRFDELVSTESSIQCPMKTFGQVFSLGQCWLWKLSATTNPFCLNCKKA